MKRLHATLGWGLYLANSWTWCIGMFLPIVMLKLFGIWGFVAFAIPNVLGCTLFGYVLSREKSQAFLLKHGGAIRWFSIITIGYQCFFAAWMFSSGDFLPLLPMGCAGALLGVTPFVARGTRGLLLGSAAVAAASGFFFAAVGGTTLLPTLPQAGELPASGVLWVLPCLALGLGLSPYLDLTFHRALQESPSRHCFLVFGIVFTGMLLFAASTFERGAAMLLWPVAAQWGMQLTFTVAAHCTELRRLPRARPAAARWMPPMLWTAAATIALTAAAMGGVLLGEDNYLRILVFYGWAVPCWLLGSSRNWSAVARFVLIAAGLPFLEMAWIYHHLSMASLPAGALLVLWAVLPANHREVSACSPSHE
ncbi:MAG: hypothetical protein EXS00_00900 [Phycisphaerales bacterium]|nr:hypothetical protein [Phycisphaerales bacterium]